MSSTGLQPVRISYSRQEGSRSVHRNVAHHNLDAIISVGYRVKSKVATQFRIWAIERLREYLVQGYAINEQRLEQLGSIVQILTRSGDELVAGVAGMLSEYLAGFTLLRDYDERHIDAAPGVVPGWALTLGEGTRGHCTGRRSHLLRSTEAACEQAPLSYVRALGYSGSTSDRGGIMGDTEIWPHARVHSEGLHDWRILLGSLHARFATGDFATGLRLLNRIGEAAEDANHHPDLDLRYPHLNVKLISHDAGGLTARDVRLARRISEIAAEEGVDATPDQVQELEIALDTPEYAALKPFWRAVLGVQDGPEDDDLADPDGSVPGFWFQHSDDPDPARMRFHLDITVPHDVAEARVAQAIEAGGRLVTDHYAPSFWVLADAEDNKVCVCTWQGRGSGEQA